MLLDSTPPSERRSRCLDLPPGIRTVEIAERSRVAALTFMECLRDRWGRAELARWLVGPYARATEPASWASTDGPEPRERAVSETEVDILLKKTFGQVAECVRYARSWEQQRGFARRMVDEGLVVGVLDGNTLGYAPIDHRRMRLVDRVRSLFVADFLTRPESFQTFQVCDCGLVTFDPMPAHYAECERPRESGVMRKVNVPVSLETGTS